MYDLFKLHNLIDLNNTESFNNTIKGNAEIIKKRVRFDSTVNVVLINTIDEYSSIIKQLLWYTDDDYILFKQQYLEKLIK